MKKILFIPSVEKGCGFGHLKRCLRWATSKLYSGFVYIPTSSFSEDISSFGGSQQIITVIKNNYDAIVFDMRKTPSQLFEEIAPLSSIYIGVDEGGTRKKFDYLIDTLPNFLGKPNVFSVEIPEIGIDNNSSEINSVKNILISFGGEDSADLTEKLLSAACCSGLFKNIHVTVVLGPFYKGAAEKIIMPIENEPDIVKAPLTLKPLIEKADIVFTSFGITAYEALSMGKKVILVNPSLYHSRLSRLAGIIEAGKGKVNVKKIKKLLDSTSVASSDLEKKCKVLTESLRTPNCENIEKLFLKGASVSSNKCPVCGHRNSTVIARFPGKNYYKCSRKWCGITWMRQISSEKTEYGESYFFDQYKNQYGKTYLEDFENIVHFSSDRLKMIEKSIFGSALSKTEKKYISVIDVGCAYGPFLSVMKNAGYKCSGIDVSESAVTYVNKNLGIDAVVGDFEKDNCCEIYHIITMWYVIEHFKNCKAVLEKVKNHLADGGIFAFSTPNLKGISGRKNLQKFLETSPDDHYTVWNPASAKRILKENSFFQIKVRCTGHHPERFPLWIRKIAGEKIINLISEIFNLGDTFEIYCIKVGKS